MLRLAYRFAEKGRGTAHAAARILASAGAAAALINLLQKLLLWLELEGTATEPRSALAALCGLLAIVLGLSAAPFALGAEVALRRPGGVSAGQAQ